MQKLATSYYLEINVLLPLTSFAIPTPFPSVGRRIWTHVTPKGFLIL